MSTSLLSESDYDILSCMARYIALSIVVGFGGGLVCGLAVSRFGEIGSLSLWLLGVVAGTVARRIGPSRVGGWSLVIACVVAFVIAETCWIHWHTKQGADSWWTAFAMWPTFVREYTWSALAGALFAAFGARSAYQQTTNYLTATKGTGEPLLKRKQEK